jgi:hypothetical protein
MARLKISLSATLWQYYEKELKPQLLIMPKLSDAPLTFGSFRIKNYCTK